jgi:hypothetical protein
MKFTVRVMELYDSMGFALLTICLAMEYYRKGLELCGGGAPGMAAAFAIAMLIRSWVDENKWRGTYQSIVPSPGKMITAAIPIQTRPSRCL